MTDPHQVRLRFLSALGLTCLAPLVAEVVASSNTPAVRFPLLLPLLILIYGLPALLIRELWMRRRIGWPGFLVLGAAYAALNEGVVAATWFKLDAESAKVLVFTAEQAGRVGGINWAVVLNLVVYHTFWSMLIPIVLMEARTRRDRGRPWLPRWASWLSVGIVAFVMVGSLSTRATARTCAAPTEVIFAECVSGRRGAALFVLLATLVALLLPRFRGARPPAGRRPPDRVLVLIGALYSVAFLASYFVLPLSGNAGPARLTAVLLLISAVVAVRRWSRAPTWSLHAAALLATGALIPGMLASIRSYAVLQPLAAALFVVFFLVPALKRAKESQPDPVGAPPIVH